MAACRERDFKNSRFMIIIITIVFLLLNTTICLNSIASEDASDSSQNGMTKGGRAYDFTIEFSSSELAIEPKGEGVANLQLTNDEDDDSYSLNLQSIPSGWSAFFENGKNEIIKEVSKNHFRIVPIYLNAPASGSGLLKVSCRSTTNQVQKVAEINLVAKYIVTIDTLDVNNDRKIMAGKSTEFNLDITNHQDDSEIISLSIIHTDIKIQDTADDTKWSVSFDTNSFTIDAGENRTVVLKVFAPNQGEPGEKINLFVKAEISGSDQTYESPELIVEIPIIYNITYNMALAQNQDPKLILPNSTVNYTLKLDNVGNVETTFSLRLISGQDWEILFFKGDNKTSTENLKLKVNAFIEFRVQIRIPIDAKANNNTILFGIYLKGQDITPMNQVMIKVDVNLVSGILLSVQNDLMLIDLGKTVEREFKVHNTGNGEDELTISILEYSIPEAWKVSIKSIKNRKTEPNQTETVDFAKSLDIDNIEPMLYLPTSGVDHTKVTLNLLSDQEAFIKLSITTPTTGIQEPQTIRIYGESESSVITYSMDLEFILKMSDLTISALELEPIEPILGKEVKVTFKVINNFHLPAKNFKVKLYKNDVPINSFDISSLDPGASEELSYSVENPKDGVIQYVLRAKLTGDIIPINNSPSREKNVFLEKEKKDDPKKTSSPIVMILLIAIIIAIVIFIVLGFILHKKYPAQEEEHEATDERIKQRKGSRGSGIKEGSKTKSKVGHGAQRPGQIDKDRFKPRSRNGAARAPKRK